MIVDLNKLVPSRLVVMDAIRAMEGNGPASGHLVQVGLLILSTDPVAVDAVGCRIMGIDPAETPLLRIARDAGLGNSSADRIEIRGADLAAHMPRSFALPAGNPALKIPRVIYSLAKNLIVPKPLIDEARCERCGECVRACPPNPKALSNRSAKVPRFRYSLCIRCYCCVETCRFGAISVKRAPLERLFGHDN
jgi:ferredoxin